MTPITAWGPIVLGTAAVQLIGPVPSNTKIILTTATFTNFTAFARKISVYVVRAGGVVSNSTLVLSEKIIPSVDSGNNDLVPAALQRLSLNTGDAIWALADAVDSVTTVASGLQWP